MSGVKEWPIFSMLELRLWCDPYNDSYTKYCDTLMIHFPMVAQLSFFIMLDTLADLIDKPAFQIAVVCIITSLIASHCSGRQLSHIPAFGSSRVLFFMGVIEFMFNAPELVRRGCNKYPNGFFRVPRFFRWVVIVQKTEFIQEIWKAPDEVLSFDDASVELFQSEWFFDKDTLENPYHFTTVRTHFTKNLRSIFLALHGEYIASLNKYIPAGQDWLKLNAMDAIAPILCRASNRIIVGSPLCQDPDWINLNIRFATDVMVAVRTLQMVPSFLKPLASALFTNTAAGMARGAHYLQPLIAQRQKGFDENDIDKPNDFLTWLMEAQGKDCNVYELTERIFDINSAGLHSTRVTFCRVLYYLAEYPEYAAEIREEVENIVKQEGWTYAAITKMVKVDSFIKESQRLNTIRCISMPRIARQPFTFSDGTHIPVGTYITVATHAIHTDGSRYSNPFSFEPFRFADKTRKDNKGRKLEMTATQTDSLTWGLGPHACPARFFVATQLKLLLALMVVMYDMKLEGPRPTNTWLVDECLPDMHAEVLFRHR
ncbi:cytochrome P450, partial [Collybia nuda]